jgi:hypothetical protein
MLREQQERSLRRSAAALGFEVMSKATTDAQPACP